MSGNWITLERRLHKDALKLAEQYIQSEYITDQQEAFNEAYKQCTKFLENQWTRAIELEIRFEKLRTKMREEAGLNKNTTPESDKPKHLYSTDITFPNDMPIDKRLHCAEEFYTELNNHSQQIEIAIEQRGHNDETCGQGLHCHANIKYNGTETIQTIYSKTKDILKKYNMKKEAIEFKPIKTCEHATNRHDYIRGIKKGLDKDGIDKSIKVQYDKLMRERLQLTDIYTGTNITNIYTHNPHNNSHDNTHNNPKSSLWFPSGEPSPSPETAIKYGKTIVSFT